MENDQLTTSVSPLALGGALTGILVLIFSIIYLFFRSSSSSSKTDEINTEIPNKPENDRKKLPTKSAVAKPVKQDTKVLPKFLHPWLCASLRAHSSSITGLNFSHNDKYLASVAEGNFVIRVFIYIFILCLFVKMIVLFCG